MKKIGILFLLLSLLLAGCGTNTENQGVTATDIPPGIGGTMYIDNQLMLGVTPIFSEEENKELLPLVAVAKGLGLKVKQTEEHKFRIQNGWSVYVLDISEMTLKQRFFEEELLFHPPGTQDGYMHRWGNELYMDCATLSTTLQLMGVNIYYHRSEKEPFAVYVSWQPSEP